MQKCSYPGCGHIGEIVTNHHAFTYHGLSKVELKKRYGSFEYKIPMLNRQITAWINRVSPTISSAMFERSIMLGKSKT